MTLQEVARQAFYGAAPGPAAYDRAGARSWRFYDCGGNHLEEPLKEVAPLPA